ncbi:stalk domain-containing protein [Paenibacillus sp. DMB20]|uniref:stalk domain-containing protein n=1 Tax=Paenibacillus sp. DMB20 TaxID=1642570 RepID=UPI000627E59D|nr:stalk domain-containing protein [Paenibacillus sp. DMB20]KKO53656.1 hypothetical protein XI25_11715 [Paenibacillus sp. DMB20]
MKKILGSFLAAGLLSSVIHMSHSTYAASAPELSLQLDHQMVKTDVHPVMKDGELYLPVYIAKGWTGIRLHWNQKDKSLTVWSKGERYDMKNGSRKVSSTKSDTALSSPVFIKDGRMMIPSLLFKAMTGASIQRDDEAVMVNTKGKRALAVADNRQDVKLYGLNENQGIYQGLVLEVSGQRQRYPWKTPVSWKESPELIVKDLNGDGKPEVVILLNQGSGTGVHAQDVHVVNPADFTEIPVEPVEETIKNRVFGEIQRAGGVLKVSVDTKESKVTLNIPDPDQDRTDQTSVGFGAVVYHAVENNRLVARLGGNISFSEFVGDLEIVYGYKNGRFEAEEVRFVPFDEYKEYVQK